MRMAEPRSKAAPARKKAVPRTKGTPDKPPKPRKVAAAAKPKAPAPKPAGSAAPSTTAAPVASWLPADAAAPLQRAPPAPRPFDPATGAWLPVAEAKPAAPAAVAVQASVPLAPEAYRRGATRSILLNIVLGIAIAFLALNFVAGVVIGLIILTSPDSDLANELQDAVSVDSPADVAAQSLLMLSLLGGIPFLWVLGTRVVPWRGTVAYLALRWQPRDVVRGLLLVPVMLLAVIVLSVAYTCATDGCAALDDEGDGSGVDALLDNLNWPVAIIVALCAGIGEEIFFRGLLQRWIGVWGQAVAFGLAHAGNAYVPQVLFAAGLGVAFGLLQRRGWSLVSLIIAHAAYDFTILALAIVAPELG